MVSLETLEIINTDLDAAHIAQLNEERIADRKNIFKDEGDVKGEQREAAYDEPITEIDDEPDIDPNDTEHMKLFLQILNFYGLFAFAFGCEVSYKWKKWRYPFFYICNITLAFCTYTLFYSIHKHYKAGNYVQIIEPCSIFGATSSCIVKWVCHLKYWRHIYGLMFAPKVIILKNLTGPVSEIIKSGLRRTALVLKLYLVGIISLLSFLVIVPVKFYYVDGIKVPLMPVDFFFIEDQSTTKGFLGASAVQGTFGVYSGFATTMFGSGFLICVLNYTFLVNLVEHDIQSLNDMWNGKAVHTTSKAYRYAYLCNICKKLQDMHRYMNEVKHIYNTKFFIYFLGSYLGQVICLYEIREKNWIPGYTLALTTFVEMMFYCLVGTQIEIANDKLCDIVSRTDWYTYDLKSQRVMQMIMHDCQQLGVIQIGNLGPLNIVTGVSILKGIYSYYTVLAELF